MKQKVTRVRGARDRVSVAWEMVSAAGREEEGVKDAVACHSDFGVGGGRGVWGGLEIGVDSKERGVGGGGWASERMWSITNMYVQQ